MYASPSTPRRACAAALCGLALLVACGPSGAPATPRTQDEGPPGEGPSVCLILIDTLRADRLSCYGYPGPSSPGLDRLAAGGVRFARVVAQNTWTRPSHGSLLTSHYPRTLGLYHEDKDTLADRFTTLAEAFDAAGYTTIGVTANPNINTYYNFQQGFDHYVDSGVVFGFMPRGEGQGIRGKDTALPRAPYVFQAALEELERRRGPYYLQLNLMEVHEYNQSPSGQEFEREFSFEAQDPHRRYAQAVRHTTDLVAEFVERLAARPGWEDALFSITSDHGEFLAGEHPSVPLPKTHGYLVYETQALVPWVLFSPRGALPRGLVVERPVRLLDLLPTLLDYAGKPLPDGIEGRSLLPLLAAPEAPFDLPEAFVVETEFREAHKLAAYAGDWKYIENLDGHPGAPARELQARGVEDGAVSDRSADEPAVAARLERFLAEWQAAHPASPPTLSPDATPADMKRQLEALGYTE